MFYAENYAGFKKILERVKYYSEQAKVSGAACAHGVYVVVAARMFKVQIRNRR